MVEPTPLSSVFTRSTGVIWGRAGCGKTTFLQSLPKPILWIMLDDSGELSLPASDDHLVLKLYELNDDDLIKAIHETVPKYIINNADKFASVVTDSLTPLAERGLNHAVRRAVGSSQKFTPSIEEPGQTAYGARRQYILKAVSNILKATARVGKHCWFTTHEGDDKSNDKGQVISWTMMLGGKANNDVGLKLSEIWFMQDNDGTRTIYTRAARNRSPMKSRMFDTKKEYSFVLKYDPDLGDDQPHHLEHWINEWSSTGRKKLALPRE